MKKLLLSVFTIGTIASASAQFDLAVTAINSPAPGTNYNDGDPFNSEFVVTNTGTTTLNIGDTIYHYTELNGNRIQLSSGVNVFFKVLTKALAPNDTVNIAFNLASISFGGTAGSFDWGYHVRGTTCCPTTGDNDATNDVFSISLLANGGGIGIVELANNDLQSYFSDNTLYLKATVMMDDIDVVVYDISGQPVSTHKFTAGALNEALDMSKLSSGIYIYSIKTSNAVIATKKFSKS